MFDTVMHAAMHDTVMHVTVTDTIMHVAMHEPVMCQHVTPPLVEVPGQFVFFLIVHVNLLTSGVRRLLNDVLWDTVRNCVAGPDA